MNRFLNKLLTLLKTSNCVTLVKLKKYCCVMLLILLLLCCEDDFGGNKSFGLIWFVPGETLFPALIMTVMWYCLIIRQISCVVFSSVQGRELCRNGYGLSDWLWGVCQAASLQGHLGLLCRWSGRVLHQGWQPVGLQTVCNKTLGQSSTNTLEYTNIKDLTHSLPCPVSFQIIQIMLMSQLPLAFCLW